MNDPVHQWDDHQVPPFSYYVPTHLQYETAKSRAHIAMTTAVVSEVVRNVDVALDGLWKAHYAVD